MDHDWDAGRTPTRRTILRTGGTLVAGGALAGCLGDGGGDPTDTTTGTPTDVTPTDATTETGQTDTATPEAESGTATSYSVSMEPVGEVTFERVPETWVANNGSWADMGIALGREPPAAVWLTERYHTQYYDEIPGVSVDKSDMVSLHSSQLDTELFYEFDADVHVMDPNFMLDRFDGVSQDNIDDIRENVAPFFGNSIFSRGYTWHDYRYYTLFEAFEKLAAAFQERERFEAVRSVHEEFQGRLDGVGPSGSDRPTVAVLWPHPVEEPTSFSPYLVGEGTSFKHLRDLGVRDAFAETDVQDFHEARGEVDYETLLEIDPDVLFLRGNEAKSADEFRDTVLGFMEAHATASQLTAVENGDVYRGGSLYQGPITTMVLTERTADQLYGVDEQLFDRERVAEIVNGDV